MGPNLAIAPAPLIDPPINQPRSFIDDEEIIVTGRLPDARSDATETGVIIAVPDIPGQRLENTLLNVPGLQQFRRSDARTANPTSQGVTLRGLGGNASSRALLFLDDVPQADPFGGWVSWPGYDALNLASIHVRKGGGQPGAGPGALAGVIELDSLQNIDAASLSAAYGSRDSMEARGRLARQIGGGSLTLGASYARGDGFVPIIASQQGAVDRAAPYEQEGLALRMVAPLSESTELQANLRGFSDERDRGVDFSDNKNSGVDASLRVVRRTGDWQWSATGYVQVREFSSQFGAVAVNRSTVTPTLDQFATPSTGLGLRLEVRPPVGDNAELRLGGEWRRAIGETRENFTFVAGAPTRLRTAGGRTDSYGVFVEGSIEPAEGLTLSGGGRLDRWEIDNGFRREVNIGGTVRSDDRFADRADVEGTARLGLGWELADALTLRASGYLGWRLPTLNELYRPFRVGADATAANEALAPERIKGVEATLDYDNGDFGLSATAFYNRLDNAISNVTLGQGPSTFPGVGFVAAGGTYRQRQNLDAIVSKGVELDGWFSLADDLNARFGYAYVDAKVQGDGAAAALDGLRPAQVPRHFANAGVDYDGRPLRAGLSLRYIGSQFEDDANSRRLDDALAVDAYLGYVLTERLRVEFRSENLFGARVEAAISGSGVIEQANPRTLWLGLRWNFE
ncbi:MAG: TonB-dependent receptor [Sphingorhabdus sp.]